MRILWLKSDLLLPLDKGGRLRTWHLMRHLARRHAITYLAFAEPASDPALVDGMAEVAEHVVTVPLSSAAKRSARFYAEAARALVDPLPYAVSRYRSSSYRSAVAALFADTAFDLVVCDFLVPAVNLPPVLPCPAVLFTHNVEADIWRRHAETQTSPVARWLYGVQHRRMLAFEGRTLARFDGILAVSDADRDTLRHLYPEVRSKPIAVIPTGVDTEYFTPPPEPPRAPHLVFTGSMDWLPNEDAVLFFCREILPLVRAEEPRATLSIVGRLPTARVRALATEPGVEVTGTVDDVRPHVGRAAVCVVPLRIGGGTRLKIFEAMAMGRAVVSTSIGAEGLPLEPGRHLLVADGARAFADAVLDLLRDEDRRRTIEAAAHACVVERYDWSVAAAT